MTVLGPLYALTSLWGLEGSSYQDPVINVPRFLSQTAVSEQSFTNFIAPLVSTRDDLRAQIERRSDRLPQAPIALTYRPLIEVAPSVLLASTPWDVQTQVRSGIWARYLAAGKRMFKRGAEDVWLPGFGYMVEGWCRRVAKEASASGACPGTVLLPTSSGSDDEVEDVVVIEGSNVVLFSVKASMMPVDVGRRAASVDATFAWYEKFFFGARAGRYAPGALKLLDARVTKLRSGEFEKFGVGRTLRVFPVVVTYDSLCETDLLYRWLDDESRLGGILLQSDVAPITLARLEEFEQLMARFAAGRSLVDVSERCAVAGQRRRLDQVIYESDPPRGPARLPFMVHAHEELMSRIEQRFFQRRS